MVPFSWVVPYQETNNGKPDFKKMTDDMENIEAQDEQQSQKQAQAARDAFVETLKARRTRSIKTTKFKAFAETRKAFWAQPWLHIQRILIICSFAYGIARMPSQLNWAAFVILGSYGMILFMLADIRDNIEKLCRKRKWKSLPPKILNWGVPSSPPDETLKKSSPELTS